MDVPGQNLGNMKKKNCEGGLKRRIVSEGFSVFCGFTKVIDSISHLLT